MKLDADGGYARDAAIDEVGVICINGPNLFEGYLHPEHNRRIWIMRPGADGKMEIRLNTGDLGASMRMASTLVKWTPKRVDHSRRSRNTDPRLIEECLQKHPSVALVAA